MKPIGYLAHLDAIISAGLQRLAGAFRSRQTAFVLARQDASGGFPGRAGAPDLYYTRFALETLTVLGVPAGHDAFSRAAAYVGALTAEPAGLPDCLSLLHSVDLLERAGATPFCCPTRRADRLARVTAFLQRCRTPDGGFSATPGGTAGPYHAFLAALCGQLIGHEPPDLDAVVPSVMACRTPGGGFAESSGRPAGQTNPTAAAMALLVMAGQLDPVTARGAACFLQAMQGRDGGLRAHDRLFAADLLSTFTALVTLAALGELRSVRLGPVARFVKALAMPGGGFKGAAADTAADVEYTFYGLGALAVLAEAAAGPADEAG